MFFRALLFFLMLPGTAAGLLPYLISRYDPWRGDIRFIGIIPILFGLTILLRCVYDFYKTGRGTLAHWEPPQTLVSTGLYKYTRNPMYHGALLIIVGQAVLFTAPLILIHGLVMIGAFNLHVRLVEEPWLAKNFPEDWRLFSDNTPRWNIRFSHRSQSKLS